MRLAGHTYAFRSEPLECALDHLAGLGFRSIEVWLGHAPDRPDEVARALAARGLVAAAVGAGGFYDSDLGSADAAFELAHAVGAPVVVACALPELLGALERRLPSDLALCVENHWDQPLARPGDLLGALADHPRLSVCLDTGHALLSGVDPERFAAALGSRLRHVHLKDARRPARLELALGRGLRRRYLRPKPIFPGEGGLDASSLLGAFERRGCVETVSFEHEGPDSMAALARLQRLSSAPGR